MQKLKSYKVSYFDEGVEKSSEVQALNCEDAKDMVKLTSPLTITIFAIRELV